MKNQEKWQQGVPKFEGLYMVAVRHPKGIGVLDLYMWRGNWYSLYDEERIPDDYNVIGFMTTTDMINSFKNSWPKWDSDE